MIQAQVVFPIDGEGASTTASLVARATIPDRLARPELHLLIPGATYDHRYWDWPDDKTTYSLVDWMARHGLATLAIDRLGTGSSTRPPGRNVTVDLHLESLGRISAKVAAEGVCGQRFDGLILIGHSLGSVISSAAAAELSTVRGLVLTGVVAPSAATGPPALVAARLRPPDAGDPGATDWVLASQLPRFAALDHDYLTTAPGRRAEMFYRPGQVDPSVVLRDEDIRDTMTTGEVRSLMREWAPPPSDLPILVVVGQYDLTMYDPAKEADVCARAARRQARYASNVSWIIVPDTGHNLSLHRTAPETHQGITNWLSATFS